MGILSSLLPIFGKIGEKVANKFFPDPKDELKRQELAQAIPMAIIEHSADIDKLGGEIIKTEAASKHWLAANWRPLTMLTFVALIVARWFGWSAPDMTEAEALELWSIVKIGLGGYVIGRSGEKVVPMIADALKR